MKLFRTLAGLLLCACSLSAQSLQEGYHTKTKTGTTNAEVIFPAASSASARLLSYDAQTDLTTGVLTIYGGGGGVATIASNALSTATNLALTAGAASFASNDVAVIQLADDTVFSAKVYGVSGATNVDFTAQLGTAVTAGAKIYAMTNVWPSIVQSTNAIRLAGEAIAASAKRRPLVVRITGTSACYINSATVHYDP